MAKVLIANDVRSPQITIDELIQMWETSQTKLLANPSDWEWLSNQIMLENEFVRRNIPLPAYL